jgi:hypothetical protein
MQKPPGANRWLLRILRTTRDKLVVCDSYDRRAKRGQARKRKSSRYTYRIRRHRIHALAAQVGLTAEAFIQAHLDQGAIADCDGLLITPNNWPDQEGE